MNINERIQKIVDDIFDGNKAAFSKCIEVKPTTISNIIGRNRASKPSGEILESIARHISGLNADWLLTGTGEMLKIDETQKNSSDMERKTPLEQLIDNNTLLVKTNAKLAERILELSENKKGTAPVN